MNENFESETTSLGKEITKEVAKSVAVNIVGNVAGIALFLGIGYATMKIQERKTRKQKSTEN